MEAETLRSKAQVKSHGSLLKELQTSDSTEDNGVNVDDFEQLKAYLMSDLSDIRVTQPKKPLDSFVGLGEIKRDIFAYLDKSKRAQLRAQQYFDEETDRVLLYGHAGTGKTHLVQAIATELKANLIEFGIHSVSQWVANMDPYTKALYQICQEKNSTTILLLENLDLLCNREEDKRNMIRFIRDVQSMWSQNDHENPDLCPNRLIIFATTCDPNVLDEKAILAFDRRIYVPTLNFQERKQLFQRLIQKHWKLGHVMTSQDMDWVARKSYGIISSEIQVVVDNAIEMQYPDHDWSKVEGLAEKFPKGPFDGVKWRPLEVNDFLEVLRGFVVLDSKKFFEYETFHRKFGNGPFLRIYEREDISEDGQAKKGKKKNGWMWTAFSWL